MKRYKRVSGAIPTERQKEEESTLKKKLTPKSIIVAALALILAASMFGCSKDTTVAEDKTEKNRLHGESGNGAGESRRTNSGIAVNH